MRRLAVGSNSPKGILLQNAVLRGTISEIQRLLDEGADPNSKAGNTTPLIAAASVGAEDEVLDLLLSHGANINLQLPKTGQTPLMKAVDQGYAALVRIFLHHGADVNIADKQGGTAILYGANKGPEIVTMLIASGADPNQRHLSGLTPLDIACNSKKYAEANLLIEAGADPNKAHFFSNNTRHQILTWLQQEVPLLVAVDNDDAKQLSTLLSQGLPLTVITKDGEPLISYAGWRGCVNSVKILLQYGADPNAESPGGWTPLGTAASTGRSETAEARAEIGRLLLESGASITAKTTSGYTPLDLAAMAGQAPMVNTILQFALDNNITLDLQTAMRWAMQNNHQDVVSIIRKHL